MEVRQRDSNKTLTPWQTRAHCCEHIVAHDVSWARKRAGHKMNVVFPCCANWETFAVNTKCFWTKSETFLCPGHKICVRKKCCARGQTGKHLCRQQCVFVCQGLNNFHDLKRKLLEREAYLRWGSLRTVPPMVSTHTFRAPHNHLVSGAYSRDNSPTILFLFLDS